MWTKKGSQGGKRNKQIEKNVAVEQNQKKTKAEEKKINWTNWKEEEKCKIERKELKRIGKNGK